MKYYSTIFGTVLYPGSIPYFDDYITSVKKQTTDDFGLLILCDSVDIYDSSVNNILKDIEGRVKIIRCNKGSSPAQNRVQLIKESKCLGASLLIFGDADDTFAGNRINSVIQGMHYNEHADFFYNPILLSSGTQFITDIPESIDSIEEIVDANFLGLSNTALRVDRLSKELIDSLYDCNSFVFDWYLYSRLLIASYSGMRIDDTYTIYRIHENTFAGNDYSVEKEIEVKKRHYELLKKYDNKFDELYEKYRDSLIENTNRYHDRNYWWSLTKAKD